MEINLTMRPSKNKDNKILSDIRKALILAVYKRDINLVEDVLHVIDEEGSFDVSWEEILDDLSGKREDSSNYDDEGDF